MSKVQACNGGASFVTKWLVHGDLEKTGGGIPSTLYGKSAGLLWFRFVGVTVFRISQILDYLHT